MALVWIAKIIATTVGETGGDFLAQSLELGYVVGFAITVVLLVVVLFAQSRATSASPRCSGPASWLPPPPAPRLPE